MLTKISSSFLSKPLMVLNKLPFAAVSTTKKPKL